MRHASLTSASLLLCGLLGCSSGSSTNVSGASDGGPSEAGAALCTSEALPQAPPTCTVAGTYAITSQASCPNNCSNVSGKIHQDEALVVTVSGGQAVFDNGNPGAPTHFTCSLKGCTCQVTDGESYVFTATGFVGLKTHLLAVKDGTAGSACSGAKFIEKGVRQ